MAILSDINVLFVDSGGTDVDAGVTASPGLRFMGIAISEAGASTASVNVVHGATAAGGDAITTSALTAHGWAFLWFGPDGIPTPDGISVDITSGTVEMAIYYREY